MRKRFISMLSALALVLMLFTLLPDGALRAQAEPGSVTELTSVAFTVTEPKAGAHPGTKIKASEGVKGISFEWRDDNYLPMSSDDIFVAGKNYYAVIIIDAKDGYEFASDITAAVNGKPADVDTAYNGYKKIEYLFTVSALLGDVDGSGSINMKDLTTLQRYINGWPVTINEANSDVNGDGSISMKDLTALQKLINTL